MVKSRNLWTSENGERTVSRPQPVTIAKGWKVAPDMLPVKKEAPRRRKYAPKRPNTRAAVAVPMAGQSHNPTDGDHQIALAKAVRTLERRRAKDAKVVKMITEGRDEKTGGSFMSDRTWEEEVQETAPPKPRAAKKPQHVAKEAAAKQKKDRKLRRLGKRGGEREARMAMKHRRHPNREAVVEEIGELDELVASHTRAEKKRQRKVEQRRAARRENATVKHFGRYYHTPLVVDVAPSEKLVGALRHMSGGYVHPALERMKSLEERNFVPARMRHTFNKRNILKPKGEVKLKRETFGVVPDTTF